jgi:hypothetical protein
MGVIWGEVWGHGLIFALFWPEPRRRRGRGRGTETIKTGDDSMPCLVGAPLTFCSHPFGEIWELRGGLGWAGLGMGPG